MKVTERKSQKEKDNKNPKKTRGNPSSALGKPRAFPESLAGFIESDKFTVCGGLIAACCGLRSGSYCVVRTGSKHVIAIVNSDHCKWCKLASCSPVQENNAYEVGTRTYLRGLFQLNVSDACKLAELITVLTCTQTNGERGSFPFTGTPPYCTVENVTHISRSALQALTEIDNEFVWGDNLIFNTKVDRTQSGSH